MKDLPPELSLIDESSEPSTTMARIVEQIVRQQQTEEQPRIEDYLRKYPDWETEIREIWSVLMLVDLMSPHRQSVGQSLSIEASQHVSLLAPVDSHLPDWESRVTELGESNGAGAEATIGRYRIQRQLGRGGFGTVFLATDIELDRLVAIKLSHPHRMASDSARRSYLLEARTLAKLDHPNIVPVYDFGMMTDGRCFVVSKYVDGQDLAQLLRNKRFSPHETAEIISTVAEALHCVHRAAVVHRDIKPANILVGQDQRIFVADFGLALAESALSEKSVLLGTPSYMSPEQIRREGHRVDGRSDQFSLGIVMYELLTGTRPFKGANASEVMQEILVTDPVPPAQLLPAIPPELSRICMKLISRLASDRYANMLSLVGELRQWLELERINEQLISQDAPSQANATTELLENVHTSADTPAAVVIPRGLRAFSSRDAYFFTNLVPGVRDRDGIPESLSHWKHWVEAPDYSGQWYRAGVISGPTGCGKSSLVRAGLIPLLGPHVKIVVVEATPDRTEKPLLHQLERCCGLIAPPSLPEAVMEIRRGGGLDQDKKLLIIIDQFEQWLHGNPDPSETELLQAVRQCDGKRVQCLLLIRDDFWLALSRFMKAADIPLQLGRNAVMVDLFDPRHARLVLTEFGRGYGSLPRKPSPLSREQEKFIDGAIQSLTVQNKVIPVQLSLFAEMVKTRDWTMSTLQRLGGSVGIGSQFLNEAFSANYAPANQRVHEEAARSVLKSMLPKAGTDIKTCRRTLDELRESSAYEDNDAFNSLLVILESELKLITATDSLDRSRTDSQSGDGNNSTRRSLETSELTTYQLSHDFLVPSIREWLSAQLNRTWRGRIEKTIVQQAEYWSPNRQRRMLPSFWEWLQACCLLPRHRLSPTEKEMLKSRDRLSLMQISIAAVLVLLGLWLAQSTLRTLRRDSLISRLQVAETSQVPRLLVELDEFGVYGQSGLNAAMIKAGDDSRGSFLLQLAQVAHRQELVKPVLNYALHQAEFSEVTLACTALQPYAQEVSEACWKEIEAADREFESETRQQQVLSNDTHLRALILLAALDPGTSSPSLPNTDVVSIHKPIVASPSVDRWAQYASTTTKIAVRAATYHPSQYSSILGSLRSVSPHMIETLEQSIGHPVYDSQAFTAVSLWRDFTSQDMRRRTSQCLHAAKWQRPFVMPATVRLDIEVLKSELEADAAHAKSYGQERAALRRAMAAALLLTVRPDDPNAWAVFRRTNDLTARSMAIQLVDELEVPLATIQQHLLLETDPGVLSALLQIVGSVAAERNAVNAATSKIIAFLYREHPDAGVHSSAKWCLTQWNDLETLNSLVQSTSEENQSGPRHPKAWHVTPAGNLMVKMAGKQASNVGRDFLISAHEVTIEQFRTFTPGRYFAEEFGPAGDCPANIIKWKDAVAYCNWLSEQEGFKAFYPSDPEELVSWQPTEQDLKGTGYRLPQEAEWEFAARAGTTTDRPSGVDVELLARYSWCGANNTAFTARHREELRKRYADPLVVRSKPVGQLLPNEYGLFDVLGNVSEWCNDLNPHNRVERAIRGGAAAGSGRYLTVTQAGTAQPNEEFNSNGFRIVRTLP